jgi:hypothetical protein
MLRVAATLVALLCCSIGSAQAATHEHEMAVLTGGEVELEHSGKAVFANVIAPDGPALDAWLVAHVLQ